jgi:hypothetical protein
MTSRNKGLLLALVHVALVASLGAKLLVDRARLPRVWVRARPVDPDTPIRGRYISLRVDSISSGPEEAKRAVDAPLAFFIPESAADPSRRPPGEELWVEVTVPRRGPPRPIRLGVKADGNLRPLELK